MDMFLAVITLFLVANMAIVFTMLRRVNLNNPCVLAYEQQQSLPVVASVEQSFSTVMNTELAQ